VLAAELVNLTLHEGTVGRDDPANVVDREEENSADAIFFLALLGGAHFTSEKGFGGPDCAADDAGGVGAGHHGGEFLVVGGGLDILGFVDDQGEGGGGDYYVCTGIT
jgi:hypothetical protein